MKTWEVIKHLAQYPDAVFVNKRLENDKPMLKLKFIEGVLSWTEDGINQYDDDFSICKMIVDDEWELVKK